MRKSLCFFLNRYDESVFDNPELPESNDHDFEWQPISVDSPQPLQQQQQPQAEVDKDGGNKVDSTPTSVTKTRKRPTSPTSASDTGRRSGRQKINSSGKDEEDQQTKVDKRKSTKDSSRISTRSGPQNDSIGTRLRGQK